WGPPAGNSKITSYLEAFASNGTLASASGMLPGWPVQIPGLLQGYGVAQDFVTQGVESPAVYDSPQGPQAVLKAILFSQYRVDLKTATASPTPFALATIRAAAPGSCPGPNSATP